MEVQDSAQNSKRGMASSQPGASLKQEDDAENSQAMTFDHRVLSCANSEWRDLSTT